jgi:hypothetical protein
MYYPIGSGKPLFIGYRCRLVPGRTGAVRTSGRKILIKEK